jgi:drug/metabolite transporter (DMT)-like permease
MFAAPLIVALLSGPMLGEWVGWRRMIAIGVGFVGVVVAMSPWQGSIHWAMLLSLAGAVSYAVFSIVTRKLASVERPQTTMLYSTGAGVLMTSPAMPAVWVPPEGVLVFAVMLLIGALGAIGHYMVILAHQRAPASVLAPFSYSQLIWMILLGYIIFGDLPDRSTMTGAAIVIVAGLYLLHRERVTARAESLIAEIPPTGGGAKAMTLPPPRSAGDHGGGNRENGSRG